MNYEIEFENGSKLNCSYPVSTFYQEPTFMLFDSSDVYQVTCNDYVIVGQTLKIDANFRFNESLPDSVCGINVFGCIIAACECYYL